MYSKRDFSRSDMRAMIDHFNPFKKLFINKGSNVASPAVSIYEAGNDANDGLT